MSKSLNRAMLIGNIGKDPEEKVFSSGGKIVKLSIATSESWKDKNSGERKEKTQWHNIVIKSEQLCDIVTSYAKKGSKVYVEGQIETRKWTDNTGADRYMTEIVLSGFGSQFIILSGGKERGAPTPAAFTEIEDDLDDGVPF